MRGATILKAEDNKTRQLNKHTLMAFSGEAGDTGMPILRPLEMRSRSRKLTATSQFNSPSTSKQMPSCTRCATRRTSRRQRLPTLCEASWHRACGPGNHTMSTCFSAVSTPSRSSPASTGWTTSRPWRLSHMPHTAMLSMTCRSAERRRRTD